jgi:hypothetical protein
MTYRLIQLAPGAYDLVLNNTVVASVVRNGSRQPYTWTAELPEDLKRNKRPSSCRRLSMVSRPWMSCVLGSAT